MNTTTRTLAAFLATGLGMAGGSADAAVVVTYQDESALAQASVQVPSIGNGYFAHSESEYAGGGSQAGDANFAASVTATDSLSRAGNSASASATGNLNVVSSLAGAGALSADGSTSGSAATTCASAPGCGAGASAVGQLYFQSDFTLDSPYYFTAELTSSGAPYHLNGYFYGEHGNYLQRLCYSCESFLTSASGTLPAGLYHIGLITYDIVDAFGGSIVGPKSTAFTFDLKLTAVPLPPAAWLLLSGMIGLLAIGARRRGSMSSGSLGMSMAAA